MGRQRSHTRKILSLFTVMLVAGLAAIGVLAGAVHGHGEGKATDGAIGPDGTIQGVETLDDFAAHFFTGTTVLSTNTVSNEARRCNGTLDEPGVGIYLFIVEEAKDDSTVSCLNLASAKANGKLVHGFVNADGTLNFVGVEP